MVEKRTRTPSPFARRLRHLAWCALVAGAALVTSSARADGTVAPSAELPAHLGLDEAVRLFRARGFDLLVAEAAVRGAEGDLRAAGSLPNPVLSAGVSHAFNYDPSCAGCAATGFSIGASDQGLVEGALSGKRRLREDVTRHALAVARHARADAERLLVFAVKSQYVQTAAARERVAFAEGVRASLQKTVELERARFMKVTNEGQLARIELEALKSEQEYARAVRDLRQEELALALLVGVRGPVPAFEVDREILTRRAPPSVTDADPESLYRLATSARPDLKASGERVAGTEAGVALERRLRVPDVAIGAQYSQLGSGQAALSPPTLAAGITLPLPLLYRREGEIGRAEADRDAASVTLAKTAVLVRNDVEAAAAAVRSEREILERFDATLLERAKRARDVTEVQFHAGAIALIDTLDAERNWIQVNLDYQAELVAYWTAVFQLEAAVGKELVP